MKCEDYEELTKDLTTDNAVDIVRSMLEKAQTDSVAYDEEIADFSKKLEDSENRYKALQVDYIQKFTSSSAEEEKEEDEESSIETEIENIMKEI